MPLVGLCSPCTWRCHSLVSSALLRLQRSRLTLSSQYTSSSMGKEALPCLQRSQANFRLCNVSGFSTELLELHSETPSLHIVFIPGNPGVVSFYKDFVEEVYGLLEGKASISAIGHVSHSKKDGENGRTFSLQDQINHKVDFIGEELLSAKIPIIVVGHSIGSYICLEIFKRLENQVKLSVGLYPFLTLNNSSIKQPMIRLISRSAFLCMTISSFVAFMGLFPTWITSPLVKMSLGRSCSATAVDATCSHLLKYHTMQNVLYMAETEFKKLSEEPDWAFMRSKQNQIAFLFGFDDHWGPLTLFEEVSRQAPDIDLSIEREGHTHAFCCTEAGSEWVARHVVSLIKNCHPI